MPPASLPGRARAKGYSMHRRSFLAASAGAAFTVAAFAGLDEVEARKRRKRGSAYANARVSGPGGRVSASVNCGSRTQSSQRHGTMTGGSSQGEDGADGGPTGGGSEVTERC